MELQTVRFIVWSASFGAGPARFLTCLEIMFFFNIFQAGGQKKRDVHVPPFIRRHFFPVPCALGGNADNSEKRSLSRVAPHLWGKAVRVLRNWQVEAYTLGERQLRQSLRPFIGCPHAFGGKGRAEKT